MYVLKEIASNKYIKSVMPGGQGFTFECADSYEEAFRFDRKLSVNDFIKKFKINVGVKTFEIEFIQINEGE